MNFFQYYGLKERFMIDAIDLKKAYLTKSRELHPDHAQDIQESQDTMSYNNKAYQVLKDEMSRIAYLLHINGIDAEDTKFALPSEFLNEMMEKNEAIQECLLDGNISGIDALSLEIKAMEIRLRQKVQPTLESISEDNDSVTKEGYLNDLKIFYFCMKYVKRLKDHLSGHQEL